MLPATANPYQVPPAAVPVVPAVQPVVVDPTVQAINEKVSSVYAHAAVGLGLTGLAAFAGAKTGFTVKMLSLAIGSPTLFGIGIAAVAAALIAATIFTNKDNTFFKYGAYGLFTVFQGLVLSPLVLINAKAFALATGAATVLTGGLGALAMTLKESFEKYEKILMIALGSLALISLGAVFLPATAGALAHKISYFGGFALFSALIVYDTHKARSEALRPTFDPINHAMSIYLDALNLLVRFFDAASNR